MQLTHSNFDYPAQSCSWDAVRYWTSMADRFARASLASQVMAGFSLLELRATHGTHPGKRTDLATSPSNLERLNWSDLVKKEAGISDETARNWMAMAKGVKKRWSTLPIRDRLRALMSAPPSSWAEEDAKLIQDAVHKATDGLTQMEFLWDLGLAKKPQGSGSKGRKPGEGGRPAAMDLSEDDDDAELNEFRMDMRLLTMETATIRKCSTKCLTVHLQEVEAYALLIKDTLKARSKVAANRSRATSLLKAVESCQATMAVSTSRL